MTTIRNRFIFLGLSVAGTIGLVSISSPAVAAPNDGVRTMTVATADLDLRGAAGRATFERRIASAARSVCAEPARSAAAAEAECRVAALAQARRDVGLADVASN